MTNTTPTPQLTPQQVEAQTRYPDRYYAQYDPHATQPTPVLGWYDMWGFTSLNGMPPLSELLPLSEDFWNGHIANPQINQGVQDGKIVSYTPPKTLSGQQAALASLTAQKKALGVYFQSSGTSAAVLFPSDDTSYANALQQAQTVQLGAWVDGTQWTLADGSSVPLTGADVTALFKKIAAYRAACQNRAAALNAALQSNIDTDLTAGWPDNH